MQSIAFVCLLATATTGWAQTRRIEGGNALDANPQVGSGGINTPVARPPINYANRYITGTIGSGAGFQGYSPIRDPSQLFISGLPSASLSGFRSGGISIGDLMAGQTNYQPRIYYDPSQTVTNIGGITRGLNQPGSSTPTSPYMVPRESTVPIARSPITFEQLQTRQSTGRVGYLEPAVQRSIAGLARGRSDINTRLLSSPLFGQAIDVPLYQIHQYDQAAAGESSRHVEPMYQPPSVGPASPLGPEDEFASPLDRLLERDKSQIDARVDYRINAQVEGPAAPPPAGTTERPTVLQENTRVAPNETPPPPERNPLAVLEGEPRPTWVGQDRYRDMAVVASAIEQQYLGRAVEGGAAETQAPAGRKAAISPQQAYWVRQYMATPITTLVGTGESQVNEYLRRAEDNLHKHRYYRASQLYDLAAMVDPSSPLPLLGQAQALMAAGEYMSAVNRLSKVIDQFPGITFFRIDLNAFLPDPTLIERRRVDLERLLAEHEDYHLRFLLGFMEYYSGLDLIGLENLVHAAKDAPPESAIARFPDLLKQRLAVPLTPISPSDVGANAAKPTNEQGTSPEKAPATPSP